MYLHFWLKGGRRFELPDEVQLRILEDHYQEYLKNPNSITGSFYVCRREGEESFQRRFVKYEEIGRIGRVT